VRTATASSVLLGAICLFSCGPTRSTTAIVQAHNAIKHAEQLDAKNKHPYELTLAHEYYVKSKEEAGYSRFELSETLAKKAIDFAKVAAGEAAPNPGTEDESNDSNP
jgi:ribosome-binding protein aMBF1 (putative translation factor)